MSTAGMRQAGSRRSLGTIGRPCRRVVSVGMSACGRRSDLTVTKNPEMFSAGPALLARGPRRRARAALRGQRERTMQQQTREKVSYKDTLCTCTT